MVRRVPWGPLPRRPASVLAGTTTRHRLFPSASPPPVAAPSPLAVGPPDPPLAPGPLPASRRRAAHLRCWLPYRCPPAVSAIQSLCRPPALSAALPPPNRHFPTGPCPLPLLVARPPPLDS
ncbi:classical arabinogalactan protein 9-like [Cryptomeria japonica]|uniref:classical arabinogalactan protein 9-like n=1 Tax=Cryptomeria japonica TaxID=3369 RepID=UPI0025ACA589|nr:classical arabinogalactan protein 9-like [Cryptomeria japonica]